MAEQEKKTVLSGIQPSGSPTLGDSVGALKNWKLLQTDDRLCYYCVANLHALTVRQDPTDLRRRAGETVWRCCMACGIRSRKDPYCLCNPTFTSTLSLTGCCAATPIWASFPE